MRIPLDFNFDPDFLARINNNPAVLQSIGAPVSRPPVPTAAPVPVAVAPPPRVATGTQQTQVPRPPTNAAAGSRDLIRNPLIQTPEQLQQNSERNRRENTSIVTPPPAPPRSSVADPVNTRSRTNGQAATAPTPVLPTAPTPGLPGGSTPPPPPATAPVGPLPTAPAPSTNAPASDTVGDTSNFVQLDNIRDRNGRAAFFDPASYNFVTADGGVIAPLGEGGTIDGLVHGRNNPVTFNNGVIQGVGSGSTLDVLDISSITGGGSEGSGLIRLPEIRTANGEQAFLDPTSRNFVLEDGTVIAPYETDTPIQGLVHGNNNPVVVDGGRIFGLGSGGSGGLFDDLLNLATAGVWEGSSGNTVNYEVLNLNPFLAAAAPKPTPPPTQGGGMGGGSSSPGGGGIEVLGGEPTPGGGSTTPGGGASPATPEGGSPPPGDPVFAGEDGTGTMTVPYVAPWRTPVRNNAGLEYVGGAPIPGLTNAALPEIPVLTRPDISGMSPTIPPALANALSVQTNPVGLNEDGTFGGELVPASAGLEGIPSNIVSQYVQAVQQGEFSQQADLSPENKAARRQWLNTFINLRRLYPGLVELDDQYNIDQIYRSSV